MIDDDEDLELSVVFNPCSRESIEIGSIDSEDLKPLQEEGEEVKTTQTEIKEEPQSPLQSPVVDQQTIMMRTILENNEMNHDDSGSYFKFVVSFDFNVFWLF